MRSGGLPLISPAHSSNVALFIWEPGASWNVAKLTSRNTGFWLGKGWYRGGGGLAWNWSILCHQIYWPIPATFTIFTTVEVLGPYTEVLHFNLSFFLFAFLYSRYSRSIFKDENSHVTWSSQKNKMRVKQQEPGVEGGAIRFSHWSRRGQRFRLVKNGTTALVPQATVIDLHSLVEPPFGK